MHHSRFRSIGAILIGMAAGAVLSTVTDRLLEQAGILKTNPFNQNPVWLIIVVVVYRTVYNTLGTFIAARLAPSAPMKHAIVIGVIGTLLGIAGAIVMWKIPPHWYPVVLVILTMPAAWLGGRLAIMVNSKKEIYE